MREGRDELARVRNQLDTLLHQAHTNQQKMRLFSEQELLLIGITSLTELLDHILHHLPQVFGLEAVTLLLVDREYELTRLLSHEAVDTLQRPSLMIDADDARVCDLYPGTPHPQLSSYRVERHQLLFPREQPLGSVALLPLMRSGTLIGSLHFGSHNVERFNRHSATDFLQHLAVIAAVCLENCINHARLKQIGLTDPLTGVSNRRYFEQRIIEACATAQRHQRPLAALFVDVDHFKRINDNWGHPAGDAVLRSIAQCIASHLRHSDVLCRYGGEEFVILLPDTGGEVACEIAERIRHTIAAEPQSVPTQVTASVGVAALESFGDETLAGLAERLVASADAALYRAKQQGRDQVVVAEAV